MPETNTTDTLLYWLAVFASPFVLALLIMGLVVYFRKFVKELQKLNRRIRDTGGSSRRHWIRRRRRLWLSLIPFVKYRR